MASINQQGNYMVKYDLNRLQKNSTRMQKALPTSGPLPEWAKSKLTEARSKVAYVADYQDSKLGLTNNEKSTLTNIASELNAASAKHKGQANRIRNLGSTGHVAIDFTGTKFVAIEVLKLTGILIAGGLAASVPAYMLTSNNKVKKDIDVETLRDALLNQPVKTAAWWAGGSSLLIGVKDNNPRQSALGAGLMALAASVPSVRLRKSSPKVGFPFSIFE